MKGKTTSSANKAKVIKELVTNPDASLRDIEKITGVDKSTVANIRDNEGVEVAKQSVAIASIIDKDKEIMDLQADLGLDKFRHLKGKAKDLTINEHKVLSEIADKSTKRVAVFDQDKDDNSDKTYIITF